MNKRLTFLFALALIAVFTSLALATEGTQRTERIIDRSVHPAITYGPILDQPMSTLNESFEGTTFPPAGWIKLSPDAGTGWNRQVNGTTPVPGWNGGVITTPTGGGTATAFCTWSTGGAVSNDQWLITPQITNVLANDSLKFYMRWWPNNFADTVQIRISTTTPTAANFTVLVANLGFPANGLDTGWISYGYRLSNFVTAGANVYIAFREKIVDNFNDGASISVDLVQVTTTTDVAEQVSTTPASFQLQQNYPNPFNPSTNIRFSIPNAAQLALKVYNTLGQEVATLAEGHYSAGTYNAQWDASGLADGMYFYKLQTGNYTEVKKLILLK